MDRHMASAGGALEQLGQLGLSEMDLLKLAASGALGQHGYNTRSHSAEMATGVHQAGGMHQTTFSPSWPPAYGGGDRDAAAAAAAIAAAHGGQPPMGPGAAYYPGAGLGVGAGLGQGPLGGSADLSYLAHLGAGTTTAALVAGGASSAAFGEGPRIYVGGVPDLVTVAMVRDHFSRWGVVRDVHFPKERTSRRRRHFCFVTFESMQAAERAVAESNREIGGYPVAAINIPTDRLTHYGLRQTSALGSPTAALRAGLPFGSGSPGGGLPSGLSALGAPPMGPSEAYASPTRAQSHSGIYSNVAHQVGAHRIRGTTSADFLTHQSVPDVSAAAQLAGSQEHDLAAALATLRLTQQQQAAMAAAANGYGSTPGSGSSTRQPSHDFSVSRSSQEYMGQPGTCMGGGILPQGGQLPGGGAVNPAAGGDIYTVLANMQRNSLSAAQQRCSPQPGAPMNFLHGGSVSAGGTPLGTPPGEGFHAMSMPRPGSAHEAQQALAASQPQQPGLNTVHSYSFLSQGQQPQPQQNSLLHHRSSSFSGATANGGGPGGLPHHPDFQSTRSHSAAMARSASPLARISTGVASSSPQPRSLSALNTDSPATGTSGSNRSSGEPVPGGLLQGGLTSQGGALPHNYSGSLHEQYLASLQASLPAALGQNAGLGQDASGQLHGSLLTMSAPLQGMAAAAAASAAPAAPSDVLHGRRHSLDDFHGESGTAGGHNSGKPASHLRGGGNGGGSVGGGSIGQHHSASASNLVNSFANARPRSAQPDASQELRLSTSQQQAQQTSARVVAADPAPQAPAQGPPNPGHGDKHGPPLESKQDKQESGGTDDSATLDAKMRDSVADLLRGSSGSLSHSLSQQQHQQAQQYQQHQEQRQGDWRHSWDAGRSDGGRGILQQQFHHHASGSLPRA